MPATKYIVPVVHYTRTSRDSYGLPVSVKYLTLGREMYESGLMTKQQILEDQGHGKNLNDVDLMVTCTDEQYQRLTVDVLNQSARWRDDKAIHAEVQKQYREYVSLIGLSVAREITAEQFLAQYEGGSGSMGGNVNAGLGGVSGGGTPSLGTSSPAGLPAAGELAADDLPVPVESGVAAEDGDREIDFNNLLA